MIKKPIKKIEKIKKNIDVIKGNKSVVTTDIIKPLIKQYTPLATIIILVLLIALVVFAPQVVLVDLIIIIKSVLQLLTLITV